MSTKVTRAEYLEDLENTRLELDAYESLSWAFGTLANLPENEELLSRTYRLSAKKYDSLASRCREFLMKLESMSPQDFPEYV